MLIEAKAFSLIIHLLFTAIVVLVAIILFGLAKLTLGSKIPPRFKSVKAEAIVKEEE